MRYSIKKGLVLILLVVFSGTSKPISKQNVIAGSATLDVLTGLATGVVANKITVPVKYSLPSGLLSGAIVGYMSYLKLYKHTPEGKFLRILKIIDSIEADDFIARSFKSSRQLKGYAATRCKTLSPIDYGQRVLRKMTSDLLLAKKLMSEIYKEAAGNPGLDELVSKCDLTEPTLKSLTKDVEMTMSLFCDMQEQELSRLGF